jgi:hypothetical protein
MPIKRLYAEFTKVKKNDDGTLEVEGIASSEAVDSDGEVIKAAAMKAAIPDYMKFGAVREMHSSIAAGTALSCEVNDEGQTILRAHVVDPVSVKKVETKVLKGFSIGGKVTGRDTVNKSTIVGLELVEISLVDRPANPDAVITCFKADGFNPPEAGNTEPATVKPEPKPGNSGAEVGKAAPVDPEVAAVDGVANALTKGEISASRLLELIKAEKRSLRKGLYGVSCFAEVLSTIGYLASAAASEADWEGDDSPVPDKLKAWLTAGASIFVDMAQEEVTELVASLKTAASKCDVTKFAAAAGIDLGKAGAKFSAKTKETLADVHQKVGAAHAALAKHAAALQKCDEAMGGLGYAGQADSDTSGKAAGATNVETEAEVQPNVSAPAGDPKEAAAGVQIPDGPIDPNVTTFQELALRSIAQTTKAAAAAQTPAPTTPSPAPAEVQRPALMVVEKTGESTQLAPTAPAGTHNPAAADQAIRKAFGIA